MALDIGYVRSQFPALAGGFAFFDNAGGSQVLKSVADRVADYLLTSSVQTGATYPLSRLATERVATAREAVARLVNAARPEEIVLGPNTTTMMRNLATAMAGRLRPGDEIVLTVFDHESNIGPWLTLADKGVTFKFWSLDPDTLEPDLEELGRLMSPRTRLVAVTHTSNILGTIMPIAEIARFVHERGAEIAVDAVAYAPHRAVDVQALDVDYYAFSFYKTYGPHFAVLYGKYDKLLELDGLYHYFYGKDRVPAKLEPGNTNYELAWGVVGIVDYLEALGGGGGRPAIERAFADIAAHEAVIGERLLAYLRDRNDLRVIGRPDADARHRVPTISFKLTGREAESVVAAVDAAEVGMRHGDFHSRRLVEHLGLDRAGGVCRVSMVHYNTVEEVDRLVRALDEALARNP
ncbi:cysteine desulfurase-like protein [Prosthecomicrobium sp. N25]|uniref:cysteine desulfurase-like protein n=1 Tax=Prosthecomicrobium sp. N25 TaxID=3129254 RepID=UPI0030781467